VICDVIAQTLLHIGSNPDKQQAQTLTRVWLINNADEMKMRFMPRLAVSGRLLELGQVLNI
jgi:hypothetical protein